MSTDTPTQHPAGVGVPEWQPQCEKNLKKLDPNGKLCAEVHCTETQSFWHATCNCNEPFRGPYCKTDAKDRAKDDHCCQYDASTPVPIPGSKLCYCCCGCLASDTLIAVDATSTKALQDFLVGEMVWVAMDIELTDWAQLPVQFSSGTGSGNQENTLIMVRFGDAATAEFVIANREQLFLVAPGQLKRASRLVPGQDELMRPDGSLAAVLDLTAGRYKKGVHHIATTAGTSDHPGGHLIVANGVVCGDYALQLRNLERSNPEALVEGHADLPEFGTREYGEHYAGLLGDAFSSRATDVVMKEVDRDIFEPFRLDVAAVTPPDAHSLLTRQQALDVRRHAPRAPVYSGVGSNLIGYIFTLFKGFYPEVSFYYDDLDEIPNAYAFREYDVTFVVVTGGLVRTDAVTFATLAFAVAQGLSRFYGGSPRDDDKLTCTGQADYAAILAVFPTIWVGEQTMDMINDAIESVETLFGFIERDHRAPAHPDACNQISIDCRLAAMRAASITSFLPHCAGGPPDATLKVVGAEAFNPDGDPYVTVTFSEAVDIESASSLGGYTFRPLTPATSATVEAAGLKVEIHAAFTPGGAYQVQAIAVVSAGGNRLVAGHTTAEFTAPDSTES